MLVMIISPAKKLDYEAIDQKLSSSEPTLLNHSASLIGGLRKLSPQGVSSLMGLSDKLGALNYGRFQEWQLPFTKNNAKHAVMAFKGDVYQGLDAASLSEDDLSWAQENLRILSGLYGILKPLDLMQAYRLEMGTKLKTERGKDLYEFWGSTITDELNKNFKSAGGDFYLINLSQKVSSSAHIEFHSRIILQKYIQRKLITISNEIIQKSYNESTDVMDLLDEAESKLYDVAQGNIKTSTESAQNRVIRAKTRI